MKFEILKDTKTGEMKFVYDNQEFVLNKDSIIKFEENSNTFEVIITENKYEQKLKFEKVYQLESIESKNEATVLKVTQDAIEGKTISTNIVNNESSSTVYPFKVDSDGTMNAKQCCVSVSSKNEYTDQFCTKATR